MATPDPMIPTIPEFFAGRDIFITGGTGFMGKVLMEKLLRSCPNINKIFMLSRPKKNVAAQDRIESIKKLPVKRKKKKFNFISLLFLDKFY